METEGTREQLGSGGSCGDLGHPPAPLKAGIVAGSLACARGRPAVELASLPAVPAALHNVECVQPTGFLSPPPGGDRPSSGDTHVAACQRWHRIK